MEGKLRKHDIVIICIFLVVVVGAIASIIHTKTNYHSTAAEAFYEEFIPGADTGEVIIEKDLGIYAFDEHKSLYIAKVNSSRLLVAEMFTSDGKYSFGGNYELHYLDQEQAASDEEILTKGYGTTTLGDRTVKWAILKTMPEESDSYKIDTVKEYQYDDTQKIYLVILGS